jgi:MFS family permease
LFGQSAFAPAYVQGVLGATPTIGGFVLSSSSLSWTLASPVVARAILRWGYRPAGIFGAVVMVAGSVLLQRVTPTDSLEYVVGVMLLTGVGFSFVSLTSLLSAQNAVSWGQRGVVTGLNQFARSIAGTVGVSLAGAVFASSVAGAGLASDASALLSTTSHVAIDAAEAAHVRAALDTGLHAVFLIFVVAALFAVASAMLLPSGRAEEYAAREDEGAYPPPMEEEPRVLEPVR